MLVSFSKILGCSWLMSTNKNIPLMQHTHFCLQPQTPSHLVEDLQDVIKQESDESGIVAEFQENGPPLLKKIKQEVNTRSFGRTSCESGSLFLMGS